MRDAAELMARGEFDTRLTLNREDEIGSLATSLNHLGERLEEFVSGQKRFLGDIAHELGSPLARMQFGLSILEQKANPDMQPLLEDVREEVAQMSALLDEILQFTKAGLQSEVHFEAVPLLPLVQKTLHQEGISGDMVALGIPEAFSVHADPHFLQRAVANVLRNALRYAGDSGPIRLEARRSGSKVLLTIADSGPGVPPAMVHRLCDPFFRTESARTRETGGVGLGLAIVKRCVEACGGSILIRNAIPHGLVVELTLGAV
jgi:two-component system sensor histidine kinase CpxA